MGNCLYGKTFTLMWQNTKILSYFLSFFWSRCFNKKNKIDICPSATYKLPEDTFYFILTFIHNQLSTLITHFLWMPSHQDRRARSGQYFKPGFYGNKTIGVRYTMWAMSRVARAVIRSCQGTGEWKVSLWVVEMDCRLPFTDRERGLQKDQGEGEERKGLEEEERWGAMAMRVAAPFFTGDKNIFWDINLEPQSSLPLLPRHPSSFC